jgi:hypothetical protein
LRGVPRIALPFVLLALLVVVPWLSVDIPVVLAGPLDSPGTLQLLALCLLFAGVALTYDLLFGVTGLLSFGHALYFAVGVYLTAIALTKWEWGMWTTFALVAAVGIALPLVLGSVRRGWASTSSRCPTSSWASSTRRTSTGWRSPTPSSSSSSFALRWARPPGTYGAPFATTSAASR